MDHASAARRWRLALCTRVSQLEHALCVDQGATGVCSPSCRWLYLPQHYRRRGWHSIAAGDVGAEDPRN